MSFDYSSTQSAQNKTKLIKIKNTYSMRFDYSTQSAHKTKLIKIKNTHSMSFDYITQSAHKTKLIKIKNTHSMSFDYIRFRQKNILFLFSRDRILKTLESVARLLITRELKIETQVCCTCQK